MTEKKTLTKVTPSVQGDKKPVVSAKKTAVKKSVESNPSPTEKNKNKKKPTSKNTPIKKDVESIAVLEEVKNNLSSVNLAEVGNSLDKANEDNFVFDESKYDENSPNYFEATGRRKTAVARVRLYMQGDKTITVNGKNIADYFPTLILQNVATSALDKMRLGGRFKITVVVQGGGINAQAEAIRHGIARALVVFNPEYRKRLRKAGFLTRDSRMKERKKFGLKRARRAPQWSKR
jgi:small subunit ribosomal protein S9